MARARRIQLVGLPLRHAVGHLGSAGAVALAIVGLPTVHVTVGHGRRGDTGAESLEQRPAAVAR